MAQGGLEAIVGTALEKPAMPFSPADRATVHQNPPDFSWPAAPGADRWELEIRGPDGRVQRVQARENRISLPAPLPVGDFEWRVRGGGSAGDSPLRRFTVPADAPRFVVPAPADLLRQTAARGHPRFRLRVAADRRSAEAEAVLGRVLAGSGRAPREVSDFARGTGITRDADQVKAKRMAKRDGQRAAEMLAEAALAWHLTGDRQYLALGKSRLLEVASWDPSGTSGIDGVHLVARDIAWGMALLYDAAYPELSPAERTQVRARILERIEGIREEFLDRGAMWRNPFTSHGWVAWAGAAAAASLLAGDDPRADALFTQIVPSFIAGTSPWGGTQGGFANGTGYGFYDVGALIVPFDIISAATGVDMYAKPWLRNVGRFLTYFQPAGAVEGPFGDAAEMAPTPHMGWTLRALAQRVGDPLIRWNAGRFGMRDGGPASLILSSPGETFAGAPFPAGAPSSALFDDVGWAALHSDLADPRRVSVYFKSSPYGSHNHSHADQNAIVLHAGGRPLLKGSGYYDFYGSDHHRRWTRTTRAKNAITFDGGRGQPIQSFAAGGRLVYRRLGPQADIVVGDASGAYDGQLTEALRTVVFLKPDLVIVHDKLASGTARRWEWNLHSDQPMAGDARSVRIGSGDAALCVDVLQSPASRLDTTTRFSAAPRNSGKRGDYHDQQHGAFVATRAGKSAEYIVALRVGCGSSVPRLRLLGGGAWQVTAQAGGVLHDVVLHGDRAERR